MRTNRAARRDSRRICRAVAPLQSTRPRGTADRGRGESHRATPARLRSPRAPSCKSFQYQTGIDAAEGDVVRHHDLGIDLARFVADVIQWRALRVHLLQV